MAQSTFYVSKTILKSTETEGEFEAQGVIRVWVRGTGGTWPAGVTVKLQEWVDFEGETGAWADDPDPRSVWSVEGKKYLALCRGRKYRLLASGTGVVARIDLFLDSFPAVL